MKKLSDRLQALIADGEIPLSDAWGKLIDDMKAIEEQEPAAFTGSGALADVACGMTAMMGPFNAVGDIPLFTGAPPMQDSEAREMLKRLAVILSGSDAPGEIRSLTVTAQSFVDRCKTLAKERDALRLAGGQPQRDMPLSVRANGEANSYTLLRDGNWFANILMNGEMTVPQQWDFLNTIAKKQ